MDWILIILGIIVFYLFYEFNKRVKKLEEDKGLGYSYSFTVDFSDAIFNHPKFLKDSGVKSAQTSKEYKDWPQADKNAFRDFIKKHAENKGRVYITYLTSEKAFFIRNSEGKSMFSFRDWGAKDIFNERILGEFSFTDTLNFGLRVKIENDKEGNYRDFLIGYLEERFKDLVKKAETKILFKFPYNSTQLKEDYYKNLGFEVERIGGDDAYEDSLGDSQLVPTIIYYKKNRAEIEVVC